MELIMYGTMKQFRPRRQRDCEALPSLLLAILGIACFPKHDTAQLHVLRFEA